MSTDASLDAARLTGLAPQFLVDDIETAIAYYRDKLSFALDFKYESFYAGVSRDGLVVHLKQASKLAGERAHRRQNEHLDAYIAVMGVAGADFEPWNKFEEAGETRTMSGYSSAANGIVERESR